MKNAKIKKERKKWYTGRIWSHKGKIYEVAEQLCDRRLKKGDVVMVVYRKIDNYIKELADGRLFTLTEDEDERGFLDLGILTYFGDFPCLLEVRRANVKLMREVTTGKGEYGIC